jgi:hypothetical protein
LHYKDLDASSAVAAAKLCRPVIDPIFTFPVLLNRLEKALNSKKKQNSAATLTNEKLKPKRSSRQSRHSFVEQPPPKAHLNRTLSDFNRNFKQL